MTGIGEDLNPYQPRVLSRAQWDLARPSALALVLRATANTPVTGRSLLSLLAMRVQPSGTSVTTPAISTLERLLRRGFDIDEVIADRGFSYKRPKDWAEPLRALGLAQVQDIHPADHGPRDANGVLLIDGVPHCERTPEHLRNITRPAQLSVGPLGPVATEAERLVHARKVAEIERFNELIAERQQYASVRNQGAPDGAKDRAKAQYICAGRAGKLQCALCPYAADYPEGLPVIANPPSGPYAPRSCSQATTVVAGAAPQARPARLLGQPRVAGLLRTAGPRREHLREPA
jgi:hypothetical protein